MVHAGITFLTIMHDHGRIVGVKMVSSVSPIASVDCFAIALWNGKDPILKERLFGLTGPGKIRRSERIVF